MSIRERRFHVSMGKPVLLIGLCIAIFSSVRGVPAAEPSDWGQKDRAWPYIGTAETKSERDSIHALYQQAVRAAVGRFYFGEEKFLARELLDNYLGKYAENFVASHDLITRRQNADRRFVRARVNVMVDRLFKDLKDKRFVYIPKTSPFFYVFLDEQIAGSKLDKPAARKKIEECLDQKGLRLYEGDLPEPPPISDVAGNPALSMQARRSAQKNEVEVILTGSIQTNQVGPEEALYYTQMVFYQSEITLHLMRVDDGEILATAHKVRRVANRKAADAIRQAIELVSTEATEELVDYFTRQWAKSAHDTADYRIMLTDVSPEQVQVFVSALEALDRSVKVYPRNYFGRVAVLNFDYEGDPKVLNLFLKGIAYPPFEIVPRGEKRFELAVIQY